MRRILITFCELILIIIHHVICIVSLLKKHIVFIEDIIWVVLIFILVLCTLHIRTHIWVSSWRVLLDGFHWMVIQYWILETLEYEIGYHYRENNYCNDHANNYNHSCIWLALLNGDCCWRCNNDCRIVSCIGCLDSSGDNKRIGLSICTWWLGTRRLYLNWSKRWAEIQDGCSKVDLICRKLCCQCWLNCSYSSTLS